ncbi:transglutaminase domain-containing protein [Candidatus Woesearchaeota archaeon]|nr:transglutaminase domain-containing protein [Candidatus Woesearchaeota archaeon]
MISVFSVPLSNAAIKAVPEKDSGIYDSIIFEPASAGFQLLEDNETVLDDIVYGSAEGDHDGDKETGEQEWPSDEDDDSDDYRTEDDDSTHSRSGSASDSYRDDGKDGPIGDVLERDILDGSGEDTEDLAPEQFPAGIDPKLAAKLRKDNKNFMTKKNLDHVRAQIEKEKRGEIDYGSIEDKEGAQAVVAARKFLKGELGRYAIQIDKTRCTIPDVPEKLIKKRIDTEKYAFIVFLFPKDHVHKLLENNCIMRLADDVKINNFINAAKEDMRGEALEKIRQLKYYENINDVPDYSELKEKFESGWKAEKGRITPYQDFVTPDDVKGHSEGSVEENYLKAVGFVWISDKELWGMNDNWIKPEQLFGTAGIDENPVQGKLVSDCSEQANALVSMLRASGMPAENVRVALGEVDFGDSSGGHAWVEYSKDGQWIVLDPTSGPYYLDGEKHEREGAPFDYWEVHDYPIKEVWAYYNDEYFSDETRDNAPKKWKYMASSLFGDRVMGSIDDVTLWEALLNWMMDLLG